MESVIFPILAEIDDDDNGGIDLGEGRTLCKNLMSRRYPEKPWDEDKFLLGFLKLDKSWVTSEENGDYVESKDLVMKVATNLKR